MKTLLLHLVLLFICGTLSAQNVSTYHQVINQRIDDDMIFDAQGNLYGSNYNGTSVYKKDLSGTVTTFAGGMNTPNGLEFDRQGNLWVCDNVGNKVYKFNSAGVPYDTLLIVNPSGIIRIPGTDSMIITSYALNELLKSDSAGSSFLWKNGPELVGPVGLVYDPDTNLYLSNYTDRKIYRVTEDSLYYVATLPDPTNGALGFITWAKGMLWATGFGSNKIYRVDPNYVDSVAWFAGSVSGSVDGSVSVARFNKPNGILPSQGGDSLFVSDYGTGRVRLIENITTLLPEIPEWLVDLRYYPNPATDHVIIDGRLLSSSVLRIELTDLLGRVYHVCTVDVQSEFSKTISLEGIPAGNYFLRVSQGTTGITLPLVHSGHSGN